jgi:Cft2 family RNA processing exonuclease
MSISTIIPVSVHQLISPFPGFSFTPYHAGHVLGACMFSIDLAGLRVLYTGDYSREDDRHLVKAEVPPIRPDVLIVESTFGVHNLEPRDEKEARFTTLVHAIIRRGGHVLLPTFALGRAQELLLILDEYWKKHPDLQNVPIYYASSLARKCMAVYQTYIHTMNSNIRTRFAKRDNPFVFKCVFLAPCFFFSALLTIPVPAPAPGTSQMFHRRAAGSARSLRGRRALCSRAPASCRPARAESSSNYGARTHATGSSSPATPSKARWPG